MKQSLLKILSAVTAFAVIFFNSLLSPALISAQEVPTPPPAPSAPPPPTPPPPPVPSDPAPPPSPDPTPTPTSTSQPTTQAASSPSPTPSSSPTGTSIASTNNPSPTPASLPSGNQTGGQDSTGGTSPAKIDTGTATNNANLLSTGNLNASSTPSSGGSSGGGGSAQVVNSQNGSNSDNTGSATVSNSTLTSQNNTAVASGNLQGATITGQNTASKNVGGADIHTGDANATGTMMTSLNTNVDGVAVAEFNVSDNHIGDIVLDFSQGCISGCGTDSIAAANVGNGSNSQNTSEANLTNGKATFQNNDATVGNTMVLKADSGSNTADKNTGGDTNVTTGDANVAANALTFVNNNLAGNVIFTTVNIFGNLIGDIIMPESFLNAVNACSTCGSGNITAINSGNGSGSNNTSTVNSLNNSNTFQTNDANIENNLILNANTAGNSSSLNTGGNSTVQTGNANVDTQVINVVNSNVSGGNWWLVIVNEAGKWVGKILGAPDGSHFAGSSGTEFVVNDQGDIIATNSGNGSGSNNNSTVNSSTNNTTVQSNNANIQNTLDLSANTGKNTADKNTGGNSQIQTGDANIIASMVNFVNNNISGGGKLFVTVVNVFGSWMGDFVTPGQKKENKPAPSTSQAIAAQNTTPSSSPKSSPVTSVTQQNQPKEQLLQDGNDPQSTIIRTRKRVSTLFASTNQSGGSPTQVLAASFKASQSINQSIGDLSIKASNINKNLDLDITTGKKKFHINLAWSIFLLPILGALYLIRRKINPFKLRIKKTFVQGTALAVALLAIIFNYFHKS